MRNFTRALTICLAAALTTAVPAWSQSAPNNQTPDQSNQEQEQPDLLTQAARSGKFTILLSVLETADLTETLKQDGPFTLFAPTDKAFGLLPKPMLQRLRQDKPMLRRILLYHLHQGRIDGKTAANESYRSTVAESNLHFVNHKGETFVDNARIVHADIEARNGLMHEIDRVLIPPTLKP